MAKIYLANGESFALANSNATIYGSNGYESITMDTGITGITTDQNIEKVAFSGAIGDYKYKQAGNTLNVYDSTGATLISTLPLQGDSDGTQMQLGGIDYTAKLTSGVMKLGGSTVGDAINSVSGVATNQADPTSPILKQIFVLDVAGVINNDVWGVF